MFSKEVASRRKLNSRERTKFFTDLGEETEKSLTHVFLLSATWCVCLCLSCMRKWLHGCLEISVQGPSTSALFSLVNLSKVSPFHCLLPFLLLGHCCLLFFPAKVTFTSVLVPFLLPPCFSCYHLSCKCHSPSLLSLANWSSLYPFPEQLKGRKLVETGGTAAFKPGSTGPIFLLSLVNVSLCKETSPFCSGWRHCVLTVSQFVTKRFVHADCKSRGETEQEGLGGCVQFELQQIVLPTGNKGSPWC